MNTFHAWNIGKAFSCSTLSLLLAFGLATESLSTALPTDGNIQGAVFKRLEMDSRVNANNLGVNVEDGRVKIFGLVNSLQEKHLASGIASSVDGVHSVRNTIRVKPDVDEDRRIRLGIEQLIDIAKLPTMDTFRMTVVDGTVTLEGAVRNQKTKHAIQAITENRPGVVEVKNLLAVTGTSREDMAIHKDVVFYLLWSPFFKQDDIQVEVDKGIITLRGHVDYLAEKTILAEDLGNIQGVEGVNVDNLSVQLTAS